MTWAWFRPTTDAWADGAHWFRCDVVGGGEQSKSFVALPKTAKGLLLGKPDDRWLVCVDGPSVSGSVKIPCSLAAHLARGHHDRRRQGQPTPTPATGSSRSAPATSARSSVGAWLNYPVDYDYGYTWFHEAEWKAGNRRSICWAKTDRVSAVLRRLTRRPRRAVLLLAGCTGDAVVRRRRHRRPPSSGSRRPPSASPAAAPATPAVVPRGAAATGLLPALDRPAHPAHQRLDAGPLPPRGTPPRRSTSARSTRSSTGTRSPSTRRPCSGSCRTHVPPQARGVRRGVGDRARPEPVQRGLVQPHPRAVRRRAPTGSAAT